MADEPQEQIEAPPPKGGPGIVVWLLVSVLSAGLGAAAPLAYEVLAGQTKPEMTELPSDEPPSLEDTAVVSYGDVTVNLDEGRMNRYLHLKIALLINKEEAEVVNKAVEQHGAVLRNWLLSHLSDKQLEEIRGKVGQNMLRREIRRQFNEMLFADRRDRVHDVLFEEFNVQ